MNNFKAILEFVMDPKSQEKIQKQLSKQDYKVHVDIDHSDTDKFATELQKITRVHSIQNWTNNNTEAFKKNEAAINNMIAQLRSVGTLTIPELKKIETAFKNIQKQSESLSQTFLNLSSISRGTELSSALESISQTISTCGAKTERILDSAAGKINIINDNLVSSHSNIGKILDSSVAAMKAASAELEKTTSLGNSAQAIMRNSANVSTKNVGKSKMLDFFKYADLYMCSFGYKSFHIIVRDIHGRKRRLNMV